MGKEEEQSKVAWEIKQQSICQMTHAVLETNGTKSENFTSDRVRITVDSVVEQHEEKIIFSLCNICKIDLILGTSC